MTKVMQACKKLEDCDSWYVNPGATQCVRVKGGRVLLAPVVEAMCRSLGKLANGEDFPSAEVAAILYRRRVKVADLASSSGWQEDMRQVYRSEVVGKMLRIISLLRMLEEDALAFPGCPRNGFQSWSDLG